MIISAIVCLAAFLMYYFQKKVYKRWWNRGLFITVSFNETGMFEGNNAKLTEVIENKKRLPLPMLKVRFQADRNLIFGAARTTQVTDKYYYSDVFRVGSREKITRKLTFTGSKRGYYRICRIETITYDLFLSATMADSKAADNFIYVYPNPFRSDEFRLSLQQINGEILTKQHLHEDPFEFRGIRPYQPYDELHHVNWKATAKTRELKVNQKNYTSLKTIRIFFNIEDTGIRKKDDAVEASFRIVAGLAEYFLSIGMQVSCRGNGRDILDTVPLQIESGSGSNHMERIYKALARQDLKQPAADFTQEFKRVLFEGDKGVITLFVSPNAYDDFVGLVDEYRATGEYFIWFYPCSEQQMPKLPEQLTEHIKVIPI